jgi:hypothetical protein
MTMHNTAMRIGLAFAAMHFFLFLATVVYVHMSSDPQAPLIWVIWAIADLPISLLYIILARPYSFLIESLPNQFATIEEIFYLPHVIHGLLGTIWWYWLPQILRKLRPSKG